MAMGLARTLRLVSGIDTARQAVELTAAVATDLAPIPQGAGIPIPQLASPFPMDRSTIETIVWADLLDAAGVGLTRTEAMSVPAIAKARHVVAPKVASTPLRLFRFSRDPANVADPGADEQLPQATWMTRTDDGVSPWHRMLWTVDDLVFYGWSLWATRRGYRDELLGAARVDSSRWRFDDKGRVVVDDQLVDASSVILIPGPHEGILTFGRTTVRHARQLLAAAAVAGQTPMANLNLHYSGDEDLTDPEIDALIARWAAARRGENGGVSYTGPTLEVSELGRIEPSMMIDGRNAAAVDCARIVGVAAAMVDATAPKASLNYETTQGRGLEHTEYGIEPYTDAIAARLSLDDVVPAGQRVRFDITQDTGPVEPTGPIVED